MAKTKSSIKEPKLKVAIKAALKNQPDLTTQLQNQFGFDGFKGPPVEAKVYVTSYRQ